MIRSSVVFPHPDGPTSAATSPLRRLNTSSPSTWSFPPEAARKVFCLMLTSSRPRAPAGDMSFKRLHQKRFDCQHDGDEGESIGQDYVEQLKGTPIWPNNAAFGRDLKDEASVPSSRDCRTSTDVHMVASAADNFFGVIGPTSSRRLWVYSGMLMNP